MTDLDTAVEVHCEDCERSAYVTSEPEGCPYCGGDVDPGMGVVVRPH